MIPFIAYPKKTICIFSDYKYYSQFSNFNADELRGYSISQYKFGLCWYHARAISIITEDII
jgi:hypothetical protein